MMPTEAEDVLSVAANWRAAGEQVALATVTETWGSSPRARRQPDGGHRLGPDGRFGLRRLHRGRGRRRRPGNDPHRLAATARFRRLQRARLGGRAGLRRQGEGVRGEARVIDGPPSPGPLPPAIAAGRGGAARRPTIHVFCAERSVAGHGGWAQVPRHDPFPSGPAEAGRRQAPGGRGDPPALRRAASAPRGRRLPALLEAARAALAADRSGTVQAEGETWFLHVHNPPLRLSWWWAPSISPRRWCRWPRISAMRWCWSIRAARSRMRSASRT